MSDCELQLQQLPVHFIANSADLCSFNTFKLMIGKSLKLGSSNLLVAKKGFVCLFFLAVEAVSWDLGEFSSFITALPFLWTLT